MTVAASDWLSNFLQAADDWLTNAAGMQTLMGVGNAAACTAKGHWQDFDSSPTAPYYKLNVTKIVDDNPAAVMRHGTSVEVYIVWPVDKQNGDSERDIAMRATNAFGKLLADLKGSVGTYFVTPPAREYEAPQRTADDSPDAGCWDATILLTSEI